MLTASDRIWFSTKDGSTSTAHVVIENGKTTGREDDTERPVTCLWDVVDMRWEEQ